jgi:hypothetical protein
MSAESSKWLSPLQGFHKIEKKRADSFGCWDGLGKINLQLCQYIQISVYGGVFPSKSLPCRFLPPHCPKFWLVLEGSMNSSGHLLSHAWNPSPSYFSNQQGWVATYTTYNESSLISYIKGTMKPPLTPRDEAAPEAAWSRPWSRVMKPALKPLGQHVVRLASSDWRQCSSGVRGGSRLSTWTVDSGLSIQAFFFFFFSQWGEIKAKRSQLHVMFPRELPTAAPPFYPI